MVRCVQAATAGNDRELFKQFSALNTKLSRACHLRGLLKFATEKATPVPLDEVGPGWTVEDRLGQGCHIAAINSNPASAAMALSACICREQL